MARRLYVTQKKALMAWVDSVAAEEGWGDWCRPPYAFPLDDEIPAGVYEGVMAMNP